MTVYNKETQKGALLHLSSSNILYTKNNLTTSEGSIVQRVISAISNKDVSKIDINLISGSAISLNFWEKYLSIFCCEVQEIHFVPQWSKSKATYDPKGGTKAKQTYIKSLEQQENHLGFVQFSASTGKVSISENPSQFDENFGFVGGLGRKGVPIISNKKLISFYKSNATDNKLSNLNMDISLRDKIIKEFGTGTRACIQEEETEQKFDKLISKNSSIMDLFNLFLNYQKIIKELPEDEIVTTGNSLTTEESSEEL